MILTIIAKGTLLALELLNINQIINVMNPNRNAYQAGGNSYVAPQVQCAFFYQENVLCVSTANGSIETYKSEQFVF